MTYIDTASPIVVAVVSGLGETSGSYPCIYSEAQRSRQAARPCCNNKSHITVLKLVLAQAQQYFELKDNFPTTPNKSHYIQLREEIYLTPRRSHYIRLRKIDRLSTSIFDS